MDSATAVTTLSNLGITDSQNAVLSLEDGATSLLETSGGSTIALLRQGEKYDTLILGSRPDCPVNSLRAVLETAVLPLSDSYAAKVGVALPERDALRKRIREASVALDVIAKGRLFSVKPPEFPLNNEVKKLVDSGTTSVNDIPEQICDKLALLNQLQANVSSWSKEINRVTQTSRDGPGTILTVEEETVFWSSLDAALSIAQKALASKTLKLSLEILARKRRATAFLMDASSSIDGSRRKAAAVLTFLQGLPLVSLRTAEDLISLKKAVVSLLDHIATKLRISSFSVERVMILIDAMASDVNRSLGRILSNHGGLLVVPYEDFLKVFEACCDLFETWSKGFDHCRKVAREAARKKGDSLPPRVRSPLSKLHSHLIDVFELRSDHHSLFNVLSDLESSKKSFTKPRETLDSELAALIETSKSLNHFDLSSAEEVFWDEKRAAYRSQISKIEKTLATDYTEIVKESQSLPQLAESLEAFRCILDKQFMSIAILDSVPSILTLASTTLTVLNERQRLMRERLGKEEQKGFSGICATLSESRLVNSRISSLLNNLNCICGESNIAVIPDVRDFAADVDRLRRRIDPSESFLSWIKGVPIDQFSSSLLAVQRTAKGSPKVIPTIRHDVISFFRVIRLVRENRILYSAITEKHHELVRQSKALFPIYSRIQEALNCFNMASDRIHHLGDPQFLRTFSFIEDAFSKASILVEKGFQHRWDASALTLSTYSVEVLERCSTLFYALQNILENDQAVQASLTELNCLETKLNRGGISEETRNRILNELKILGERKEALCARSSPHDVQIYLNRHCLPLFNEAILGLMDRASSAWIESLREDTSILPSTSIGTVLSSSGQAMISCSPYVSECEMILYQSLSGLYSVILSALQSGFEDIFGFTDGKTSKSYSLLTSHIFDRFGRADCSGGISPFAVAEAFREQLSRQVGKWNSYSPLLKFEESSILSMKYNIEESPAVLEFLTNLLEEVNLLESQGFSAATDIYEFCLRLDGTAISSEMLKNTYSILTKLCEAFALRAGTTSQEYYSEMTRAINVLKEVGHGEEMGNLVQLQKIEDTTLAICKVSIENLESLELKFENISRRLNDTSLSKTKSTETWILSDCLKAHFRDLHSIYGKRRNFVLLNRESLRVEYERKRKNYQSKLTALFADFQTIRNDVSGKEAFIESEVLLQDLEHQLTLLSDQGSNLECIGRALGAEYLSERSGAKDILVELQRLKNGLQRLSAVERTIQNLSVKLFKETDPNELREQLENLIVRVDAISKSTGAKREAKRLTTILSHYGKVNLFLGPLWSLKLSPPRERDLLQQFFGQAHPNVTLGDTPLQMLWALDLTDKEQYLQVVLENAAGEAVLCDFLNDISKTWTGRKCSFVDQNNFRILQEIPDLLVELEENLQELETMRNARHARLFESDRLIWERRLSECHSDLEVLAEVQSQCAHLRTLFGSNTGSNLPNLGLRSELSDEFAVFSSVNTRFVSAGKQLESAPGIVEGFEQIEGLKDMLSELHGVIKGLSKFLERQRSLFPRFFFLADNDLLQVLSVTFEDIGNLMPHVGKLFPGVSRFVYEEKGETSVITAIVSKEGEVLSLSDPVGVASHNHLTEWVSRLHSSMVKSQKHALLKAIDVIKPQYSTETSGDPVDFIKQYLTFPAQISQVACRICFASIVEERMTSADVNIAYESILRTLKSMLSNLCERKSNLETIMTYSRRSEAVRDQLIKELVYQRDTTQKLLEAEVASPLSHIWNHEVRYYISDLSNASDIANVQIRCASSSFDYGWEYLGAGETLVHTNVTSRCFLSLSEALRGGFGGSPFGPAGTGKTETVKALGRIHGRFVAVFNCDESFDSISVGRILAGACRVGCWICFDEFNRLSANILSSTSGQLASLQQAIKRGTAEIPNFCGGSIPIKLKSGVGIFITMNPSYTGRRELPANLKSLFRPCCISRPDSASISEVLLVINGFKTSNVLSRKLVALFDSLRSILVSKSHYDFGLRSLKTCILACGNIIRSETGCANESTSASEFEENIVVRGVAEVLKPKLDMSDVSNYEAAVALTFTEATCLSPKLPSDIEEALLNVIASQKHVENEVLLEKARQLYCLLRHQVGVMLVGPTGSGKSTTWRTLFEAMKLLSQAPETDQRRERRRGRKSSVVVIDAKLLSIKQLYGSLDALTREWTDGIFTNTLRTVAESAAGAESSNFPLHWIVFDGDVDPDWIENLNSVLDDNRILTLPSGEQIPLPANTRIIFETQTVQHANPSTVSRCGMICFGGHYGLEQIFSRRISLIIEDCCPEGTQPRCIQEFANAFMRLAKEALRSRFFIMRVPLESILHSFTALLRSTLNCWRNNDGLSTSHDYGGTSGKFSGISKSFIVRILMMTSVKAIGSGLGPVDRKWLTAELLEVLSQITEIRESLSGSIVPHDLSNVTVTKDGQFLEYRELVPKARSLVDDDIGSPDAVIPTPTTVRLESLLQNVLNPIGSDVSSVSPILLCGPPGCGKSMLLSSTLRSIPNVSLATLSFSSETKPGNLLAALKAHTVISKRPNGSFVLHPKSAGCRVVLFCDEINLEKPDEYATQRSVSLLRCLAEHGGFWDGIPPRWVIVEGVQIVAACNPEDSAGRHKLSERFLRHCQVISVEQPSFEDLHIIYGVFVESLLSKYHRELISRCSDLTTAMVEYFKCNKEKFCPEECGPLKPHYIYSPRELSRWIRGLTRILLGGEKAMNSTSSSVLEIPVESAWLAVIAAFSHEARRLFCDRLITIDERNFANTSLGEIASRYLGAKEESMSDVLFTSWTSEHTGGHALRLFKRVDNLTSFRNLIYQKLRLFAEEEGLGGSWMSGNTGSNSDEGKGMIDQFAVTDDVLTHLTRIERVLCNPMGHAVIIGAPGTGKKTLSRFAAWMLDVEVQQVRSHSAYTEQEFANDLRMILKRTAFSNRHLLLIFDDSHAMESGFLEMMNSLLACGEVPGLFSGDERSNMLTEMRQKMTNTNSVTSSEQSLYNEFVRRVRNNLHIIFTISTETDGESAVKSDLAWSMPGEDISKRSPALYNRCTVDWMGDWNRLTLEAVAELKIEVSHGLERDQIIRCAVDIHECSKRLYQTADCGAIVTPRHFLEFIEQLNRVALEKGNEIQAGVDRHTEGLRRLRNAGTAVDNLKESLAQKSSNLQKKEKDANEMLLKMMEEQGLAEKSKVAAEQLALAASEASQAVQEREAEVSAQLDSVQPKIEAAREAVGSIRKEYLDELRAMPNPPPAVKIALEGVLMVLDVFKKKKEANYSWTAARAQLRNSGFIANVVNFNVDTMSKGLRSRIEKKILQNPEFDVQRISYASRAAGPLAEWTLAILDYAAVKEAVEPLEAEVVELQLEQTDLLERQELSSEEVDICRQRIDNCKIEYAKLVAGAEKVRQEIQESEGNLKRAEEMLDSLGEEWDRWIKELNVLNSYAITIWGNAVFGAAFLAYSGALDHGNRLTLTSKWKDVLRACTVPFDEKISIPHYLTSAEERGLWSSRGLATDNTSLENFAILKRSARFPLIVDPTRKSAQLLRRVLENMDVSNETGTSMSREPKEEINVRISESSFAATGKKSCMRSLESAMRFGTSILVEEAEKFDRAVTPLLGQESSCRDSSDYTESMKSLEFNRSSQKTRKNLCQRMVRLGEKDVFLNAGFRLYLSSASLKAVPKCAVARSNIVSFELSSAALQISCISRSVELLAPELWERKRASLAAEVKYRQRQHSLENMLLSTVNNVEDVGTQLLHGSLLNDLTNLKKEVREIEERRKEEQQASLAIQEGERIFTPLGRKAVQIFEVLRGLVDVYPLYCFTSNFFLQTFEDAIRSRHGNATGIPKSDDVKEYEVSILKKTYVRTAASLFPEDRLPFAGALSFVESKGIEANEISNSTKQLLEGWQVVMNLSDKSMLSTEEQVSSVISHLPRPIREKLIGRHVGDINSRSSKSLDIGFDILRRMIHQPFSVFDGIGELACSLPGGKTLIHHKEASPEAALRGRLRNFAQIKNQEVGILFEPVLLCSRGENSDPSSLVTEMTSTLQIATISFTMGSTNSESEMGDVLRLANERSKTGSRILVFLKNMHLASKSTIHYIQSELSGNGGKLAYLLVMVAEVPFTSPSSSLLSLASLSRFLSFEAPTSFRSSLSHAIERLSNTRGSKDARNQKVTQIEGGMRILLAWTHACLTERSLNTPVGFSKQYEFSENDLLAGWDLISDAIGSLKSEIIVEGVAEMLKTCVYGCRIENETDQEILNALIGELFSMQRVQCMQSGWVEVVSERKEVTAVKIAIDEDGRDKFIQGLGLEVNPEWYHMAGSTTEAKRVKAGKSAIGKLVNVSKKRCDVSSDEISTNATMALDASKTVDNIMKQALQLEDLDCEGDEEERGSSKAPLGMFWKSEEEILADVVEDIKCVARDICEWDKMSAKRKGVLGSFREEIGRLVYNGSLESPSLWKRWWKVVGEGQSISGQFTRISRCVKNVVNGKKGDVINLSHTLRPKGLMSAFRFETASSLGVAPHVLKAKLVVDDGGTNEGYSVSGIAMSGGRWDKEKGYFTMSEKGSWIIQKARVIWSDGRKTSKEEQYLSVPLHGNASDGESIASVMIPISGTTSHGMWRLRGVYLFITS